MPNFDDFSEAYEVTKTLEIVTTHDFDGSGGPSTIRIEIIHCLQSGKYTVRWSLRSGFHLQPSYPTINGKFASPKQDFWIWAPLSDMPWVDESDEDRAVQRAIGWLKDRLA